jgi:uncharacterized membrane protein
VLQALLYEVFGIAFVGPVMAYWLGMSFLTAFLANLGLMAFFFVYVMGFIWAFDKVFGLPQSAV